MRPQHARSALPAVAERDKRDIVISSNNYRSIILGNRMARANWLLRTDSPYLANVGHRIGRASRLTGSDRVPISRTLEPKTVAA